MPKVRMVVFALLAYFCIGLGVCKAFQMLGFHPVDNWVDALIAPCLWPPIVVVVVLRQLGLFLLWVLN